MNKQTTTSTKNASDDDDDKPPAWFEKWSAEVYEAKPPAWFERWSAEVFEPLSSQVGALSSKVETSHSELRASISDLQLVLSPLSSDDIFNIPVVGADEHGFLDLKAATYTWFNYFPSKNTIVGAAHCALSVYTDSPNEPRVFVELPESILKLGVCGVHLYNPYDGNFTNPLPTEKDVVVVEVSSPPPAGKKLHDYCCHIMSSQKEKSSRHSRVVGRGLGGAVTSSDGLVRISSDGQSGGILKFLLHLGEPGDSGTLLLVKVAAGTYYAIAVFNGVENGSNGIVNSSMHHRRGIATLLPAPSALTFLPVIFAPNDFFQSGASVTFFNSESKSYQAIDCTVHPHPANYPGAVVLRAPNGGERIGVYVKAQQPIHYVGMADIFKMRGHL